MLNLKIILKTYFKIFKISFFFTLLGFDPELSRMFISPFYYLSKVFRPNTKDIIFFIAKHFVIVCEIVLTLNSNFRPPLQ